MKRGKLDTETCKEGRRCKEHREKMSICKTRRVAWHRLLSPSQQTEPTLLTPWLWTATAAAKSLPSCPTLRDPMGCSPSGSPVPGTLQARALEWVAIAFSSAWKWKVKVMSLSRVWLFATPWTAAYQAPPSMGFSRQEYWSGVPLPSLANAGDTGSTPGLGRSRVH